MGRMHRGEETRDKLMDETARLVRLQGFSRTSVNTVLQAAGIKKGALYHHFPGKDDLGLAVLARYQDSFLGFLDGNLDPAAPMASLNRFFTAALRKHRETGFAGGCIWGNTALEMSDSDVPHIDVVKRTFNEWIARIARVIRSGQAAEEIRSDLSASQLAYLVVAGIEGGIMLSRLTKKEGPLKTCMESLRTLLQDGKPAISKSQAPAFKASQEVRLRKTGGSNR